MKKLLIIICIAGILAGIGILVYPSINQYLFEKNTDDAISLYNRIVENMSEEEIAEVWAHAQDYNDRFYETRTCLDDYDEVLDITGTGMMGYIEIPKIGVSVPIYHGVDETTHDTKVGHMKEFSLPVGGESTHAVLFGHSGLATADLFSELDKLEESDMFFIRILDKTLAYRVDQIDVVKPVELYQLQITEGKDYVTLVTCTPYGINTHRLLVRGERTDWDGPIPSEAPFWQRLPTQYRHMLIVAALIVILIIVVNTVAAAVRRIRKEY